MRQVARLGNSEEIAEEIWQNSLSNADAQSSATQENLSLRDHAQYSTAQERSSGVDEELGSFVGDVRVENNAWTVSIDIIDRDTTADRYGQRQRAEILQNVIGGDERAGNPSRGLGFDVRDWIDRHVANLPSPSNLTTSGSENAECMICQEPYNNTNSSTSFSHNETPVELRCKHIVGDTCIRRWFLNAMTGENGKASCPMCRTVFFENPTGMRFYEHDEEGRFTSSIMKVC